MHKRASHNGVHTHPRCTTLTTAHDIKQVQPTVGKERLRSSHRSGERGYLLTSGVNSRLTHCQHNPRGSLLENLDLWCQAALHNSPAGLLPVLSRTQCGCAAAERPVITAAPRGHADRCRPTKTWTSTC